MNKNSRDPKTNVHKARHITHILVYPGYHSSSLDKLTLRAAAICWTGGTSPKI